ncbi:MAG: DUF1326 domain-containing protein [Acidobacteriota bacterium]
MSPSTFHHAGRSKPAESLTSSRQGGRQAPGLSTWRIGAAPGRRRGPSAGIPRSVLTGLAVSLVAIFLTGLSHAEVTGDYLEARTADVYVGACFANSEIGTAGKKAILAWTIRQGTWNGVPVDGLTVAAVLRATSTLGDPDIADNSVRSLLFVDARATPPQQQALVSLARSAATGLLDEVVAVHSIPIEAAFHAGEPVALLRLGDTAEIRTRALHHADHLCIGNTELYYPPLVDVTAFSPVFTRVHRFDGAGLGETWSSPGKSSAFVASFSR